MSSTGQIVGGVVGGVIGFYLGGPTGALRGAAIGASIGGYIDPPPGPNLYGPTLDDKSFQSTAYGVSIPKLHGSIATTGNIIYLENNEYKAVARKESTGGKGGGSSGSYTTTTYYATFAVALGEAMPGSRVRRIWAGGKLIYSLAADDMQTLLESGRIEESFKYYDGSQTYPDSRIESVVGVGRTPSYEGTAYIVFYDFDLTMYGNGLAGAAIKVELVQSPTEWAGKMVRQQVTSALDYSDGATGILLRDYSWFIAPRTWRTIRDIARSQYGSVYDDGVGIGWVSSASDSNPSNPVPNLGGVNSVAQWWRSYYSNGGLVVESSQGDKFNLGSATPDLLNRNVGCVVHVDSGLGFSGFIGYSPRTYGVFLPSKDSYDFIPVSRSAFPVFGFLNDGRLFIVNPDDSDSGTPLKNRNIRIYEKDALGVWVNTVTLSVPLYYDTMNSSFAVAYGNAICVIRNISNVGVDYRLISLDGDLIGSGAVNFSGVTFGNLSNRPTEWMLGFRNGIFGLARRRDEGGEKYSTQFVYFILDSIAEISPVGLPEIVESYLSGSGVVNYDLSGVAGDMVWGYRVSGPGSARGALSQLQVAYLFDLVERGYTLACVKRGAVPDELVPWNHLDARPNGEAPKVLVKKDYETDSQLPSRYSITYLDYNREYDSNTQYADFPSRGVNERNENLAIVMDADQAAQLSDILGNLAWLERSLFVISIPQIYLSWKPGDVKSVEVYPGKIVTLRVNDITYTSDQRLEVTARLAEPSVYDSASVGSSSAPPIVTIPFIGQSYSVLMDIPMILDSTDFPGFVAAMYGNGSWPGGVLFRSSDEGQTYSAIQAFTGQATIGVADNVLMASQGFVIDRKSALRVSALAGNFDSISEQQMMTGRNYCAYGQDGRWEIIQYASAILQGDGIVTLSSLVRGLRGTEWATGLHEVGDYVVLLDDPDNAFIGYDIGQIGLDRTYKAVTIGQDLGSASVQSFTYHGVNLKPLSPVLPKGENVDDDWIIEWTPRTRYTSSFWVTGNQPPNEPVMLWQVDIMDGDNVLRTIESTIPTITYTQSQQIEDFGSVQASLNVVIYQISERVGRGYPLEASF